MQRLLPLIFLLIALAAQAQNWQPLRAGYTYITTDASLHTRGGRYVNQLVTDSASADSQDVYLGYSFRPNPDNDSGYALPGWLDPGPALLYQRDHILGRLAHRLSEGRYEYVQRIGRSLLRIPVNGSLRPGDSLAPQPLRVMSKTAVVIDGAPDSLLTIRIGRHVTWAEDQLVAFSKNHGIRRFPPPASTFNSYSYDFLQNQSVERAFPTGTQPSLPFLMRDWVSLHPGDSILYQQYNQPDQRWTGSRMVHSLVVDTVGVIDSGSLHSVAILGHSRLGTQAMSGQIFMGQPLYPIGPATFSSEPHDRIEYSFQMPEGRPFESTTPHYWSQNPGDTAWANYFAMDMAGQYFYDSTLGGYRWQNTPAVGLQMYHGRLFKTWDPPEWTDTRFLMQGTGYQGSIFWKNGGTHDEDQVLCIGRPGTGSHCGTVDVLMGASPALEKALRAHPNPTSSTLTIEGLPAMHGPIQIINPQGQVILQSPSPTLDVKSLAPGLYQWRCGVYAGRVVKE